MNGIVMLETIIPVAMFEKKFVMVPQTRMITSMTIGNGIFEKRGGMMSVSQVFTPRSFPLSAPPRIMDMPIVAINPQFAPSFKCFSAFMGGCRQLRVFLFVVADVSMSPLNVDVIFSAGL